MDGSYKMIVWEAPTMMKSLIYEDWYKMDIPAAARGAESS
jgi:hypothetical protein